LLRHSTEQEELAIASALSLQDQSGPSSSLIWTQHDTQEVQDALSLLQQLILTPPAVTAVVGRKEDPTAASAQSGSKYEIVSELFSNLLRMQKKLLRVIHQSEVREPLTLDLLLLTSIS
jgi:hypothetical protein